MTQQDVWISVLPETSSRSDEKETIRGIEYNVFISPHDVPVAARGRYDPKIKRFVIEFRYIDDESWTREPQDDSLSLRVGRRSGRLYGLEVDVDRLAVDAVGVRLHAHSPERAMHEFEQALEQILDKPARRTGRKGNIQAVENVLRRRKKDLLDQLEACKSR